MAEKMTDIAGKSEGDLKAMVAGYKRELFNLRFQQATGEMENTARFREVRRDIARVQTALTALKKHAA